MKFLIDSSFFMLVGKADIFSELRNEFGKPELCTIDLVIKEMEKMSEDRGGKKSAYARLALQIIKKEGVRILKTSGSGNTDMKMADTAEKSGFVVCTQDKGLIRRLKKAGIRSVYLLQRNRKLAVVG
jgi:rRNA-processing protein FCF1